MMLKATNLNALLSQNTSAHVADIFIFTAQGTLIAYSSSSSPPMTLRMHATLAASVWSSYASLVSNGTVSTTLPQQQEDHPSVGPSRTTSESSRPHITYLTLELKDGALAITPLRCGLLLCLMGPSSCQPQAQARSGGSSPPPQRSSLPNGTGFSMPSETASSASNTSSIAKVVQHVGPHDKVSRTTQSLRTKAETLVKWLDTELANFKMPGAT